MEGKESFFKRIINRFRKRLEQPVPSRTEGSKRSGLRILDDIIPPNSKVEDFREVYNQLGHQGTLSDIVLEIKKLSSEPIPVERIGGELTGLLSEEDECLTLGAKKDGGFIVGVVQGYFIEYGIEWVAALVRESDSEKPKMWMVPSKGSEADEYSFRFGYM